MRGQPHQRNLDRGLDRDPIEMREVSPMGGLLSQEERTEVLRDLL